MPGLPSPICVVHRPFPVRSLLIGLAAILAFSATADTTRVYKTVNPDGSVSYSDQPSERAKAMDVRPVETVPAFREIPSNPGASTKPTPEPRSFYRELNIVKPTNESAFWSGNGEVEIAVSLQPALRSTDRLQIVLDGKEQQSLRELKTVLSNVDRGTHQLEVRVVSAQGDVLQRTQHTFTLHRPSVKRKAN